MNEGYVLLRSHFSKNKQQSPNQRYEYANGLLHSSVYGSARTYIHQLNTDTGCRLEDLLRMMANWDWWLLRVKEILAIKMNWRWWWWWWWTTSVFYLHAYVCVCVSVFVLLSIILWLYVNEYIYIYIYIYHHHHHHHVTPLARSSVTLSRHSSLSSIASNMSSRQHSVSVQRVVVDKFKLVVQHMLIHVKGSIKERRL